MTLKFKTFGQELRRSDNAAVAASSVSFVKCEFELDNEWNTMSCVKAVFRHLYGQSYVVLLDLNNECDVPHEVLSEAGFFNVGLIGIGAGEDLIRSTTVNVSVRVNSSAEVEGTNSVTPTPSELEQIEALLGDIEEIAQSVRDDADAGEFDGNGIASVAKTGTSGLVDTYTITYDDDRTPTTFTVTNGEKGDKGDQGDPCKVVASAQNLKSWVTAFTGANGYGICIILGGFSFDFSVEREIGGETVTVAYTGTAASGDVWAISPSTFALTRAYSMVGVKGDTGNGIASVAKTGTSGLVDTYTITYTDGETDAFTVTNGAAGAAGADGADGADGDPIIPAKTTSEIDAAVAAATTEYFSVLWTAAETTYTYYSISAGETTTKTLALGDVYRIRVREVSGSKGIYTMTKYGNIRGAKGDTGATGADGQDGEDGVGIPSGGTTGQYLVKSGSSDYEAAWSTLPVQTGGEQGPAYGLFAKTDKAAYDAAVTEAADAVTNGLFEISVNGTDLPSSAYSAGSFSGLKADISVRELPAVTSADAGKVARVNSSGQWAAVSLPSASGVSF